MFLLVSTAICVPALIISLGFMRVSLAALVEAVRVETLERVAEAQFSLPKDDLRGMRLHHVDTNSERMNVLLSIGSVGISLSAITAVLLVASKF
jgi:hypothetical protein